MKRFRIILLFAAVLLCLASLGISASAFDITDVKAPSSASKIVYGYSGAGRELVAYQFGNGSNVLVAGFEIHGYEDNFSKDGGCLVYTADQLMQLLDQNRDLITDYGWTVYILPSMNPDGLMDGYTNNGPGRCSTTYLDTNGNLVSGTGIDLNRSFPTSWTHYSTSRNFNGYQPLSALEAQALAKFVKDVKGKEKNICLDVHGWYTQIITSTGSKGVLFQTFKSRFPKNTFANCATAIGYFTAYTTTLGYDSCLFEFPDGIYSMDAFRSSGYCESFNACVLDLLKAYGVYSPASQTTASAGFTDVIPWAWYCSAVDYVVENHIFKGLSETEFAPNVTMNRAMLVTTLWRMSRSVAGSFPKTKKPGSSVAEPVSPSDKEDDPEKPAEELPEEPAEDPAEEPPDEPGEDSPDEPEEDQPIEFSDVPSGKWYSEAVQWAAENGIVNGMPDGTFQPLSPLTREQMAAIFYRYANWCGKETTVEEDTLSSFPDGDTVSKYAVESLRWASSVGLIQGVASADGINLQPKGTATRAQAAAIIMRYLEGVGKK